jgi:hypothetical protein
MNLTQSYVKSLGNKKQPITLTIGFDARCIVFGNNVGSDPFSVDTFMGLADWIGIVTTCGAPVQEINYHIHEIQNPSRHCEVLTTPSVPLQDTLFFLGTAISDHPSKWKWQPSEILSWADDGGSMHLWNIGLLRDYTAQYPRRLSIIFTLAATGTWNLTFQVNVRIQYLKKRP